MQIKLGLVGLGYIGSVVLDFLAETKNDFVLQAVYDIEQERVQAVQQRFPKTRTMPNLTAFEDCDVIIEAATQSAVEPIFDKAIEEKKIFIPMSIGAFLSFDSLYSKYSKLSDSEKRLIIFPAGAIGGFDCIETAQLVGIDKAKITTRKPLRVFKNHPYVLKQGIEVSDKEPTTIFVGNAKTASQTFPRSVNVAARLALATLGPTETEVEVIADPSVKSNIHEVTIISKAGNYTFRFQNLPSPTNPRTSWIAALSLVYQLKKLANG
ncbi:MAG: aspartate dehydrogenase domain-containing protein [Candidatus Heimdallarchaeaceae archaeon]